MYGAPALQLLVCFFTLSHSDAEGNATRPSRKLHLLSYSMDHMSFEIRSAVPSNTPENSFPVRRYLCAENDAVIRMIIKVAVSI